MAIKGSTLPPGHPVYTFISKDGQNLHIDSNALRDWCVKSRPRIELAPVQLDLAESFIKLNCVSIERIIQLILEVRMGKRKLDPIIFCEPGEYITGPHRPDTLLVDGHHRYVIAAIEKWPLVPCHLLMPQQWRRFRVVGLPNLTQEQLNAAPTQQKDY